MENLENPNAIQFTVKGKSKKNSNQSFRDTLAGYLFISPMLIVVIVLTLIPILLSFIVSLTNWNFVEGISKIHITGFQNYRNLFHDTYFLLSLRNNVVILAVIPVVLFLALILAVIIEKASYFKSFFRIVYFMPYISSFVAVAILWRVLFHPTNGPINNFLHSIGIEHPPFWLADKHYALISIMIIMVWTSLGFNMVIFMAGLQNIPKDLYEAASIDGANPIQQFRRITIPMLSPTTFFLFITGTIHSFKTFDLVSVLTNGGPSRSTSVVVYYLYETAFVNLKSGYASAMGIVLLFFILLITIFQWIGQKKWVNY